MILARPICFIEQSFNLGQIGLMREPELRPYSPRLSGVTTAPLQRGDDFILSYYFGFRFLNAFPHFGDES
jgi:hypothetical protein